MGRCPDCLERRNGALMVDFDHLFHIGPITDDYGDEVWLPITDERDAYLKSQGHA